MKLSHILIFVGVGLVVGGGGAFAAKCFYERKMLEEIEEKVESEVESYKKEVTEWRDFSRYAARKVYEIFKQIGANCEIETGVAIRNAVDDKMTQFDPNRANQIKLDNMIYSFTKFAEESKERAETLAQNLKYTKEEKIDLDELYRMRMGPIREAAEENMVPGDDDGPALAPNGDILDDAWDEEESDDPEAHGVPCYTEMGTDIYLISEEEFMNDFSGYDKESVNYYAADDVLLDEDEEIMDKELVGRENLEKLVDLDIRVIFVRNDIVQTDYEILYNDGPAFLPEDE